MYIARSTDAYFRRPLHITELTEALAIDLEQFAYDETQRMEDPEDIMSLCGSLVTMQSGVLKLAHYSVKEYLTSDRLLSSPQFAYYVSSKNANFSIGQSCLLYLQHYDNVQKTALGNQKHDPTLERDKLLPLYSYSICFWPSYYRSADQPKELTNLVLGILGNPSSFFTSELWRLPNSSIHNPGWEWGTIFEEIESFREDMVSLTSLLRSRRELKSLI